MHTMWMIFRLQQSVHFRFRTSGSLAPFAFAGV